MLGLSLWEGRLPGRKAIENEDKGSHCSYRPESNFGTSYTVTRRLVALRREITIEKTRPRAGARHAPRRRRTEVSSPTLQRALSKSRSARMSEVL